MYHCAYVASNYPPYAASFTLCTPSYPMYEIFIIT